MYTVLLGVVLSAGAQAPSNVYLGYPAYGYGCYCPPVYAVPVAYPVAVPVVVGKSETEKTIANLRKRLKTLEDKFAQTEPQVKLTREALVELAGKVDKIDDHIKTREPQFLQMLKDLNGRIDGVEDTIKTKGPMIKAKLDELNERVKGLEDSTKPALESLTKRVKKVEKTLKKQDEEKKQSAMDSLNDRVRRIEDTLRPAAPQQPATSAPQAPAASGLNSSLDRFIDRLKKVDVEMRDDGKVDAILDRLGRVESTQAAEQQKLQSAIDALRSLSENVEKGFLGVNSRLRLMEESLPKSTPQLRNEASEPKKEAEPKKDAAEEDGFGLVPPAPTAMLIINLPADAKVFLNGQATQSTGAVRSYVTPNLTSGKDYAYEVRAELTRDGQTVTETRQVTFQAGSRVNVSFADLGDSALTKLRTVRAN